jgi:hypothetical protein
MRPAYGYIRVSSDEQADSGLGLEAQRQRIRAYCELKGLQLTTLFEDPAVSGGKPLSSRPAGSRLLADARRHLAEVARHLVVTATECPPTRKISRQRDLQTNRFTFMEVEIDFVVGIPCTVGGKARSPLTYRATAIVWEERFQGCQLPCIRQPVKLGGFSLFWRLQRSLLKPIGAPDGLLLSSRGGNEGNAYQSCQQPNDNDVTHENTSVVHYSPGPPVIPRCYHRERAVSATSR